ncbi:FAD-dependent monooxygenase [Streptomyces sp. NPDC048291]|uniref:FAD-dependent monooxygenase n=1 Tax=Streptomyces sp. NPDC048291 TaxID=3365530 RepID=UPI00371370BA
MANIENHPKVDVAIVGCGPAGQLLAIVLGRRVSEFERRSKPHPLPHAVVFDHEAVRLPADVRLAADLAGIS